MDFGAEYSYSWKIEPSPFYLIGEGFGADSSIITQAAVVPIGLGLEVLFPDALLSQAYFLLSPLVLFFSLLSTADDV
jgi:hypothetical protein